MVPRLLLRLVSLLSLGLAVLPLAGGTDSESVGITEAEREALLAHLEESWTAWTEAEGPSGAHTEGRAPLEALRLRMQAAASLEEALRVLSDLMGRASPQGQDTPEASISVSRTPTWLPPARFW